MKSRLPRACLGWNALRARYTNTHAMLMATWSYIAMNVLERRFLKLWKYWLKIVMPLQKNTIKSYLQYITVSYSVVELWLFYWQTKEILLLWQCLHFTKSWRWLSHKECLCQGTTVKGTFSCTCTILSLLTILHFPLKLFFSCNCQIVISCNLSAWSIYSSRPGSQTVANSFYNSDFFLYCT